jgi:hypothetical protein
MIHLVVSARCPDQQQDHRSDHDAATTCSPDRPTLGLASPVMIASENPPHVSLPCRDGHFGE